MRLRLCAVIVCALAIAVGSPLPARIAAQSDQTAERFDVLIVGGRVLDGAGNPWFYADVGIRDGKIVAVGRLAGASAGRTINARGRLVAPGFIDLHSHADDSDTPGVRDGDARRRAAPNLVSQGVTTVVANQDGSSPWPIHEQKAALEQKKIGLNTVLMVGHNTIRRLGPHNLKSCV